MCVKASHADTAGAFSRSRPTRPASVRRCTSITTPPRRSTCSQGVPHLRRGGRVRLSRGLVRAHPGRTCPRFPGWPRAQPEAQHLHTRGHGRILRRSRRGASGGWGRPDPGRRHRHTHAMEVVGRCRRATSRSRAPSGQGRRRVARCRPRGCRSGSRAAGCHRAPSRRSLVAQRRQQMFGSRHRAERSRSCSGSRSGRSTGSQPTSEGDPEVGVSSRLRA